MVGSSFSFLFFFFLYIGTTRGSHCKNLCIRNSACLSIYRWVLSLSLVADFIWTMFKRCKSVTLSAFLALIFFFFTYVFLLHAYQENSFFFAYLASYVNKRIGINAIRLIYLFWIFFCCSSKLACVFIFYEILL